MVLLSCITSLRNPGLTTDASWEAGFLARAATNDAELIAGSGKHLQKWQRCLLLHSVQRSSPGGGGTPGSAPCALILRAPAGRAGFSWQRFGRVLKAKGTWQLVPARPDRACGSAWPLVLPRG